MYLKIRRYNRSIDAYFRATEINPGNLDIKLGLAQILFKRKRIHEAIFVLMQLYEKFSDNAMVNYRLAAYHAYLHKMFEAQLYFQKALNLNFKESVMIFKHFPKTRNMPTFLNLANEHNPQS
jgi:tetratricopeptide (TPR) repeat protein